MRKRAGRTEDRLEIRLLEVLSDVAHDMGEAAGLEKDGVERDLQLLLADDPTAIEPDLRLVKREWPTEVGPVDLMCRDADDAWVAVEIKRIGTIDAVEQLTRYLDCIRVDPARADCRGILVAQQIKPQAIALAESADRLGPGRSRGAARRARARTDALRLAEIPGEQPLALGVHLAPYAQRQRRERLETSRLRSTRHAPATKPSTVNVFFVVALRLLNTARCTRAGRSASGRGPRGYESNAGRKRTGAGAHRRPAAHAERRRASVLVVGAVGSPSSAGAIWRT